MDKNKEIKELKSKQKWLIVTCIIALALLLITSWYASGIEKNYDNYKYCGDESLKFERVYYNNILKGYKCCSKEKEIFDHKTGNKELIPSKCKYYEGKEAHMLMIDSSDLDLITVFKNNMQYVVWINKLKEE